ncbi:PAF-acetylhydrolase family member [Metarhizium rileyi]|uniref:Putative phospholipase n=1 Tax=Metarhizium rileyi (strain RCEF 4871) TaxID=1649241 RepID=A0A166XQY5_METRR|nr:PAF-acetylhydrolase family member [Metarhizium rileyi RCEF 4871]
MPIEAQQPSSPTLELASLSPTSSVSPDSPLLTPTPTGPRPRWALPSRNRSQRLVHTTCATSRAVVLRVYRLVSRLLPSPSLKSAVPYALLAYTLACVAVSVPPFASRLPAYTGPHAVGAIDLEVPLARPQLVAEPVFKDSQAPAFELETVLFTLYYPTNRAAKSTKKPLPWIPKPISLTARGYARLARIDSPLTRPVLTFALWLVAGAITIPAEVDTPLYNDSSPHHASLPVVIFSHGMASSRTDYTNYLGELASRGTIVAALEHRDGSSPASLINVPDSSKPKPLLHFRASHLLASPTNNTPVDTPSLKKHQLAFRDAEMLQTIRVLRQLNANAFIPCTRSVPRESLSSFASRLDFSRLTTAGHSYGATSTLQALKYAVSHADMASRPDNPSVAGIALDPGKESGPLNAAINVPLLVVHSNSWSKQHTLFFGRPHFDTVRDLVAVVLNRTGAAWFLTSLGTSHPSVTDAPLIEPLLLSWTTGATLNVKEALKEYVRVSDDFIKSVGTAKAAAGVLKERITHKTYNKWVSDARREHFPKHLARLWEIHVSPASSKDPST